MKRSLFFFLTLLAAVFLAPAAAATDVSSVFRYGLNGDGRSLIWGVADGHTLQEAVIDGVLTFPDTAEGDPIVGIARNAFQGQTLTGAESVRFPNQLLALEYRSFSGLAIHRVDIPNTVINIIENAFEDAQVCHVTWPSTPGCSRIRANVFRNCAVLETVMLPSTVTSIGNGAFAACTALREINFSGTMAQWRQIEIEDGNEILTAPGVNIVCSDGTIPADPSWQWPAPLPTQEVFTYMTNDQGDLYIAGIAEGHTLAEAVVDGVLVLPDSVYGTPIKGIGTNALIYGNVGSIKTIHFPDQLTWIGFRAMQGMFAFDEIVLPDTLTRIENRALEGLASPRIALPSNPAYTTVNSSTFYYCGVTKVFTIPANVTHIEASAFGNCRAETVNYGGMMAQWRQIQIDENNEVLTLPCADIVCTDGTIPAVHRWDNGAVTREPTETEPGVLTYTCSVCKKERTESIPVIVPISTPEPTATSEPTATLEPTATSEPTATLEPTATPEPTATAKPAALPVSTATPEPTATAEPAAIPTAMPTPTVAPLLPATGDGSAIFPTVVLFFASGFALASILFAQKHRKKR